MEFLGWSSPIGISIFLIGLGLFIYLISNSKGKDKK